MKNILIKLLESILEYVKSDNSNLTLDELEKTIDFLREISSPELNATEAAKELGVCRKTFDTYVKNGYIPEGKERAGSKLKTWLKTDVRKWKLEMKKKT